MRFRFALLGALIFSAAIFGFFYAWVCSTLWGLDTLSAATAIEAMNAMNRSVRNAVFAPAFFGTPVMLAALAGWAYVMQKRAVSALLMAASVLYIVGAFLPTALVNVPMNAALMETDMAQTPEALTNIWQAYSDRWQVWNLIRALVSGGVVLCVGLALMAYRPDPRLDV